jgi:predicted Na+-dependent transporter
MAFRVTTRAAAHRLASGVLPLRCVAALAALVAPSQTVAEHSELLLAALVLATALGIEPHRLVALRRRPGAVLALAVGPFLVLVPLAWAIGRLFDGAVRDGVAALGGSADVDLGPLLGSFALVVLLALATGLAARAGFPRLGRAEPEFGAIGALAIAALVYAALSGTADAGGGTLGAAVLAGAAFLAASAALAAIALRQAGDATPAFCLGLRDFAVAAALAGQAFGPRAAVVAGVYGVMMLVAGAALAAVERRRTLRKRDPPAG